jgi:DNA-binding NarL/FixJ family response regulator
VILLADSYDEAIAVLGLVSGTVGVVSKEGPLDGVVRALRALARGEVVVPRAHTMRLLEELRSEPEAGE